ncbi:MAG: HDOD domain-containing protein [Verrucomicrobia bacterium]|nr:HDOD domain-containing protein [Verrucomicrobiota bacterium]
MKSVATNWAEEVESIGTLPALYHELNAALNDPRSSLDRFGEIIETDAGLATRLLRIANSPFYGFPTRIETISEALTLIGMQQIRDLIAVTFAIEHFHQIPATLFDLELFWQHSLACGISARVLAVYRRDANPERFFLAGLLHDIGRLVMCLRVPEQLPVVFARRAETDRTLTEAETEVLGVNHAEIGSVLLERWLFAPAVVDTVRWHHAPHAAARYPLEASMIHVADILAHSLELGFSGEPLPPTLEMDAWNRLNLGPASLRTVVKEVDRQFDDALSLFI